MASQNWTFEPDGNPGGAGTLRINGKCLDILDRGTANGTKVQLFTCNGGANQQWLIDGSAGQLFNPVSGRCLADPGGTKNGVQLQIGNCTGKPDQAWILPASPVQSGIAGPVHEESGQHDRERHPDPESRPAAAGRASSGRWSRTAR